MMARPPTSAVLGRNVKPARRTDGLLLILADDTRVLRPTVFTVALNLSDALCPVAPRDATPERATTSADLYAGTAGAPENTRETALRTDVDVVSESDADDAPPPAVTERTAVRGSVADLSFVSPVGNTRENAASAATAAGATTMIAKIHVSSLFITLRILYHKYTLKYNKKYPAIAGHFFICASPIF